MAAKIIGSRLYFLKFKCVYHIKHYSNEKREADIALRRKLKLARKEANRESRLTAQKAKLEKEELKVLKALLFHTFKYLFLRRILFARQLYGIDYTSVVYHYDAAAVLIIIIIIIKGLYWHN